MRADGCTPAGLPPTPGGLTRLRDAVRPRHLFARIYLHFVGVLLVVALTVIGITAFGFRSTWIKDATTRVAHHIANLVGNHLHDPPERDRLVRQLAHELGLNLAVTATSGELLAQSGKPLPELTAAERDAVRHGVQYVRRFRRAGQLVAPIRDPQGRWVGTLQLAFKAPIRAPNMSRHLAAVALVLLVVGLGIRPLARRITRPIERLTTANRRFGDGDLAYRIPVLPCPRHPESRAPEQLTELVRSWNDMASRIERLVRGQKELLANVSHELRSPLARIRLAMALLPEDPATQVRVREVETDLVELDRLIDDVLSTARLEASGLPLRLEHVDVRKLVGQLGERSSHAAGGTGSDEAMAATRIEATVEGTVELVADGALLKRAVWNLLENAAKYGAPPVRLIARGLAASGSEPERVQLIVEDEGQGIPASERESVFAAFHRLDKARTRAAGEPGGFGLGLTFARRVAEVHGGSLRCEPLHDPDAGGHAGCRMILELPSSPA